jgi:DNA-binding CsgD family transcriptional regulator
MVALPRAAYANFVTTMSAPGQDSRRKTGRASRTRKQKPPSILAVRLRVTLPKEIWSRPFSMVHPDLHLELVDRLQVGRGLTLVEVQIQGGPSRDWEAEIRGLPKVVDVEVLRVEEESGLYRVTYRGDPFIPLLRDLRLLRHFPIPIQAGVATWAVVGPESKVHRLLQELASRATGVQVVSVRRGPPRRGISSLTPRQNEVLRRALLEGYFDVPRRISLTELARRMGLAISTLSVTLAVIEKKILEPLT